jgi:hypothetical protein
MAESIFAGTSNPQSRNTASQQQQQQQQQSDSHTQLEQMDTGMGQPTTVPVPYVVSFLIFSSKK